MSQNSEDDHLRALWAHLNTGRSSQEPTTSQQQPPFTIGATAQNAPPLRSRSDGSRDVTSSSSEIEETRPKQSRSGNRKHEPTAHRHKRVSIMTQHTGSGYKATQESLTDPTLAFPSRLIQQSINEAVTRQTATGSVETRRRAADKVISRQLPPSRPIQQSVGGAATRQAATGSVETHRRAADRVMSRRPAAELNTISDEDIFSDGWREDILPPYPELWLPPTHTRSIIAGAFHRDSVTPKEECAGRSAKYHRREGSFVKLRWETNIHQDVFRFVDTYDKHAKQVDFELMKTKTELEREVLFKAKAGIAEAARHYARDMQIYRARRNKRRYRFPTAALGPDPPEHIYYTLEELVNLVKKEIRLTNENRMRRRKNLKEIPSNSGMNVTKLDPITMEFLSEEDWNLVRHWRRLPKILSIPSTFDDSIANELPEVDLANLVKARYERGEDEYGRTAADRNSGESESSTGEDDEIATSSDEDDSNDEGN